MIGTIFDIRHFSIHDGPGIRTTVFLKGCPLRCAWCHNPESQLLLAETYPRVRKLGDKEFEVNEQVGRYYSVPEVMKELEKDRTIFDESNGGVTFSGGEPLMQPEFIFEILAACKKAEIHTAVDTCGFTPAATLEGIAPFADLFLFDLKLIDNDEHIKYTGVSNVIILENLDSIAKSGKQLIVRIPLIPEITDTEKNLAGLRDIIGLYPSIQRVDILPFHSIAKSKYERLGKEYLLKQSASYENQKARQIRDYFLERIPTVSIGG